MVEPNNALEQANKELAKVNASRTEFSFVAGLLLGFVMGAGTAVICWMMLQAGK